MVQTRSLRMGALSQMREQDEVQAILNIKVSDIAADPNQPRTEFDPETLRELGENMKADGQHQPVLVRRNPDGPTPFLLFDGERRWRSAQLVGMEELRAEVYGGDADPETILDRQFMINYHNEKMSLTDQARYMQRKLEQLKSVEAVAEHLKLSAKRIYKILQVTKATGLAAEVRDSGLSTDPDIIAGIGTLQKRSPEAAQALVEAAKQDGKITRAQVTTEVARTRPSKKKAASENAQNANANPTSGQGADRGAQGANQAPESKTNESADSKVPPASDSGEGTSIAPASASPTSSRSAEPVEDGQGTQPTATALPRIMVSWDGDRKTGGQWKKLVKEHGDARLILEPTAAGTDTARVAFGDGGEVREFAIAGLRIEGIIAP